MIRLILCFCIFVSIHGQSDQSVLVQTNMLESTVYELKQQMVEMQRHIASLENGLIKQTSLNNKLLDQVTDLRKENVETKKQLSAIQMELTIVGAEHQNRRERDYGKVGTRFTTWAGKRGRNVSHVKQQIRKKKKTNVHSKNKIQQRQRQRNVNATIGQVPRQKILQKEVKKTDVKMVPFHNVEDRHIPRRRDLNLVAFSVYPTSDITGLTPSQILIYDSIIVNEGNAYDVTTGIFTAPLGGLYLFSFSIEDYQQQTLLVVLKKDGKTWSEAIVKTVDDLHSSMGGNTILLHVNKGSRVWLEVNRGQHIQSYFPTFSGVLLY